MHFALNRLTCTKMDAFNLTLRFDDREHLLTAQDGLPIGDVAKLLTSLSEALALSSDQKVVLSEIRGNCYALDLATNSVTAFESMKVIHRGVSQGNYAGFNSAQRKYASTLKSILRDELTLDVYDNTKDFRVRVESIQAPPTPIYYYESKAIYGVVTEIGGKTIDGASSISINHQTYQIRVTAQQEKELIQYFKRATIRFILNRRLRFDDDTVVSATLENYMVSGEKSLAELVDDIKEQYPEGLFENDIDSVSKIRQLRGEHYETEQADQ